MKKFKFIGMRNLFILIVLLGTNTLCLSQEISPEDEKPKNTLKTGFYLSFSDFVSNDPIELSQIKFIQNVAAGDLLAYLEKEKTIKYSKQNATYSVLLADVWGFYDGENVFLNRSLFSHAIVENTRFIPAEQWVAINTLATLSVVHCVKSHRYHSQTQGSQVSSRQFTFIFNTKDGHLYEASLKQLKKMIVDDQELLTELNASREKKQDKLYIFLKRYNDRHPAKFF